MRSLGGIVPVSAMMPPPDSIPCPDRRTVHTTAAMQRVCVIGAGFSGLACAQALRAAGVEVVVIDKGRAPGGRCATRYLSDRSQRCDVGAQFWTARDPVFAAVTAEWVAHGWAESWGDGFPVLGPEGVREGRDGHVRWRAVGGMATFMRHVATDLTVLSPRTVTAVQPQGNGWSVTHVAGDAIRGEASGAAETLAVDAVVLTQPVPQILTLLAPLGVAIPPAIAAVRYDPCLYLIAERSDGDAVLPKPGGLRIGDPSLGVTWLGSARRRGLRQTGEGIILHADAVVSAAHWDAPATEQVETLVERLNRVLARMDLSWQPTAAEVRRWKYSRCVTTVNERTWQPAPGLCCVGDAFGAAPRLEGAWLSGLAGAQTLTS